MSATIRFTQPLESVSARLNRWLAGGAKAITRQQSLELALRSGSLPALAAVIANRLDQKTLPVHIAVARPLVLQPAVFSALASELHFLTDRSVEFVLIHSRLIESMCRRPIHTLFTFGNESCWSQPTSIRASLPYFASLISRSATANPLASRIVLSELPRPGRPAIYESSTVDIVLWSTIEPPRNHDSLETSLFVRMLALDS